VNILINGVLAAAIVLFNDVVDAHDTTIQMSSPVTDIKDLHREALIIVTKSQICEHILFCCFIDGAYIPLGQLLDPDTCY
jgi:hypothetical protein